MTPTETGMLREFIAEQKAFNKTILDEVHTLNRGLYGDQKNGVKGLVQRQEEDESARFDMKKEIHQLKGFRNKMIWTGVGFIAGIQGIWELIKWKAR